MYITEVAVNSTQHIVLSGVFYYVVENLFNKFIMPKLNIADEHLTRLLILTMLTLQINYIVIIHGIELHEHVNYYGIPGLFE